VEPIPVTPLRFTPPFSAVISIWLSPASTIAPLLEVIYSKWQWMD
jgi:hypothetical protein